MQVINKNVSLLVKKTCRIRSDDSTQEKYRWSVEDSRLGTQQ